MAAIQAAHIHPSTPWRGLVQLSEQLADAVQKSPDGVHKAQNHAVSAVAGTGPPFNTDIHF